MHFPQVRELGGVGEARRTLHPAAQHLQREDLHLPLVLDARARRTHLHRGSLQVATSMFHKI